MKLTAVFQKVPGGYVGFVEELPGANTQGCDLAETRKNLAEAVELILDANRQLAEIGKQGKHPPFLATVRFSSSWHGKYARISTSLNYRAVTKRRSCE